MSEYKDEIAEIKERLETLESFYKILNETFLNTNVDITRCILELRERIKRIEVRETIANADYQTLIEKTEKLEALIDIGRYDPLNPELTKKEREEN